MDAEVTRSMSDQLIEVLQRGPIGLATVAVVADAIAASARFNIWILEVAKKHASDIEMLELADTHAGITEQCAAAIKQFNADRNTTHFRHSIQQITRQLTTATKREFHR